MENCNSDFGQIPLPKGEGDAKRRVRGEELRASPLTRPFGPPSPFGRGICPKHLSILTALAIVVVLSFTARSYVGQGRGGAVPDTRPAPRWPDGHINLGPVPGSEMGLWDATPTQIPLARPDVASDFGLFAADAREPTDPFLAAKPKLSQIPFQPWARSLFAVRVLSRQEPYTRCKPSSGARQVATAYGTQFLEVPELKRFYIIETGGAHSFRTVFMDGRAHPAKLSPSDRGHSVGHWEGDSLIIDTVGFNEKVWVDNLGMPTTDKLHTIEKITRINYSTITYEITIDDPGAYTATWKSGFYLRWTPGESFEFVCQENNQAPELIMGEDHTPVSPIPFVP